MKKCSRCKETKDLSDYSKNKSRKDGLQGFCRSCQNAQTRSHYRNNKDYYVRKALKHNSSFQAKLAKLIKPLKDNPCADCKNSFHPAAMDFDHIRGKKLFSISAARRWKWSLEEVLAEISKCELVCANCHRVRTFNRQRPSSKLEMH
jgi:hypothetical protein